MHCTPHHIARRLALEDLRFALRQGKITKSGVHLAFDGQDNNT
jgi:predicted RNA-binding protein associated with RNAse of E/G family